MQVYPAHAAPGARSEWRIDASVGVQVADAAEWPAPHINSEALQVPDGVWHQPFATGLIDWSAAPLDHDYLQPCPSPVQCGCQPRRAAARDKQVDHVKLAKAAFSTLIRVRSTAAFSAEKARAVIQAV